MREILFRGKAINRNKFREYRTNYKNGDWVYGLISKPYCERFPSIPLEMTNTNGISGIDVDYKTIGQYTGLCDKNGNKIFEGDILQRNNNPKDIVKIVFGKFFVIDTETETAVDEVTGWHCEVIPTDAISEVLPFCLPMPLTDYYISRCNVEVIGNVHDNPELLKERMNEK